MSHSNNESNLRFVNTLNQLERDTDGHMMIESHNPGDNRKYRIVDHKGSRNLSDLMTCHETELFIAGMIAMSTTLRPNPVPSAVWKM